MLNFTNNVIDQACENFMKQIPGFHREPAEAKIIQKDIEQQKTGTAALVDTSDVHAMMIGAAGVGKTAHWLYPCIEYALTSGMSFVSTDTNDNIFHNHSNIAKNRYGYKISIIDLRNPTRSDGFTRLHLVNKYTDLYKRKACSGPHCGDHQRAGSLHPDFPCVCRHEQAVSRDKAHRIFPAGSTALPFRHHQGSKAAAV